MTSKTNKLKPPPSLLASFLIRFYHNPGQNKRHDLATRFCSWNPGNDATMPVRWSRIKKNPEPMANPIFQEAMIQDSFYQLF